MMPKAPAAKPAAKAVSTVIGQRFAKGVVQSGIERCVPEETPIAFSYDGSTHAVMMATPADLEDFAVGFSLTEGIVATADDIVFIETVPLAGGVDVRIGLTSNRSAALTERRRRMAGPVGCGLCGIESIEQAMRPISPVRAGSRTLRAADIAAAMGALSDVQALNRITHAVHGAGVFLPGRGLVAMREDVGRHNALDKLIGAAALGGFAADRGAIVVTSRLSVEMVQKAAIANCPFLIAISAPTALAIKTAAQADMTLVGIARGDDFEVFTGAQRIRFGAQGHVAGSNGRQTGSDGKSDCDFLRVATGGGSGGWRGGSYQQVLGPANAYALP